MNGIIPVLLLCFLLSAEDLVRDPADQDIRADPDHNAGGHAGEEEDRKIQKYPGSGDDKGRDRQLPEVVGNTAGQADADHGKEAGPEAEVHDQETDQASGHGIDHAEQACEQESCHQDPYHVDGNGIAGAQPVKSYQHDQIGQPQLDARNTGLKGKDGFYIGKDQGQPCQHGSQGDPVGGKTSAGSG